MDELDRDITSDLNLVAAYLTMGANLVLPLDDTDPKRIKFTVKGINLKDIRSRWIIGELSGNLSKFSKALRDLKMLIHE